MTLADEIARLDELRTRGVLTDEEFQRAKERLIGGTGPSPGEAGPSPVPPTVPPALQALNAFRRSRTDRWIGGVCGGLARSTGLESWVWRLIFALLVLLGGAGLLLYVLLWILVPSE